MAGVGRVVELSVHREAKISEAEAGVGLGGSRKFGLPLFPALPIFGKGLPDHLNSRCSIGGKLGYADFLEEGKVALFLAWDDLSDEEGGAGGDGFLGESSTRFADDKVLLGEDRGHFGCPAEEFNFGAEGSEGFFHAAGDVGIPSGANGDEPTGLSGEGSGELSSALEARAEEIKHARGVAGRFIARMGCG